MNADSFPYRVKRQRRKTLAVHVLKNADVEVRVPKWVGAKAITAFVEQHSQWIIQQREQRSLQHSQCCGYAHGDKHLFLGELLTVVHRDASKTAVLIKNSELIIQGPQPIDINKAQLLVEAWFKKQAKSIIEERLDYCWSVYPKQSLPHRPKPSVTMRKMRRRWGSCNNRGHITINWLLLYMPLNCLDYVIFHELTHLWVFNHTVTFYQLLEKAEPSYKAYEQLIEDYAVQLPS